MTRTLITAWLTTTLLMTGCGPIAGSLREVLDPVTAVTVTSSAAPLVLYRDDSARAAHARDFVYIGPVMVNNMGNYRYFLWFGVWSTIPETPPSSQRDGFEAVTLFVDSEPLQLVLSGWNAASIGASGDIYVKPVASAADAYYEVTIDQVRLIGEARDLRVLTSGTTPASYELWSNQAGAFADIRAFVYQARY